MCRLGAFLALLLLAGCANLKRQTLDVDLPPNYVQVERGDYGWRAISADGVVMGLRYRWRNPEGSLPFWSKVLVKELRETNGYLLQSRHDWAAGKTRGEALVFGVPRDRGSLYVVVLYITEHRIHTLEIGGPKDQITKDLPVLKAFAAKLRLL